MRAVFYSPMANADTDLPSGVSRMGGFFVRALSAAGVHVDLPGLVRTYVGNGNTQHQVENRDVSLRCAAELIAKIKSGERVRPDLWFSYHVYHKSPDWIGPLVTDALNIPYVIAEGSHAPKRAEGTWKLGYDGAALALRQATLLLAMTRFDRVCLEQLSPGRVRDFRPFIDTEVSERTTRPPHSAAPQLIAAGMMRDERKRDSYRLLASALQNLVDIPLRLTIAGDGPFRREIEALFGMLAPRHEVVFTGAVGVETVRMMMKNADLFAWPGLGEAYGLVFLEAQAAGLPVVACKDRGVPDVTRDGETALLSPPGDVTAFSSNLRKLIFEPDLRVTMGAAARQFVTTERSIPVAAARLKSLIAGLVP